MQLASSRESVTSGLLSGFAIDLNDMKVLKAEKRVPEQLGRQARRVDDFAHDEGERNIHVV